MRERSIVTLALLVGLALGLFVSSWYAYHLAVVGLGWFGGDVVYFAFGWAEAWPALVVFLGSVLLTLLSAGGLVYQLIVRSKRP